MTREDLMEALSFLELVREYLGEERFLRHREVITDITISVIDHWKSEGREINELFRTKAMLHMVNFVIYAQEALDRIKDGDNTAGEEEN